MGLPGVDCETERAVAPKPGGGGAGGSQRRSEAELSGLGGRPAANAEETRAAV